MNTIETDPEDLKKLVKDLKRLGKLKLKATRNSEYKLFYSPFNHCYFLKAGNEDIGIAVSSGNDFVDVAHGVLIGFCNWETYRKNQRKIDKVVKDFLKKYVPNAKFM